MLILALSTSSKYPSAALLRDGEIIGMECDKNGLTHSETIMPLTDKLLRTQNIALCDIDAFAVDAGPGSFTGVRIGVSAVNAMAYALKKTVIRVDSLHALAYPLRGEKCVCSVIDARNENIYSAAYHMDNVAIEPYACTLDEFLSRLDELGVADAIFVGDGAQAYANKICDRFCDADIMRGSKNDLYADAIANTAFAMYGADANVLCEQIVPLYLRPTQAERMYELKRKAVRPQ